MIKNKLKLFRRVLGLALTVCLTCGIMAPSALAAGDDSQVSVKSITATRFVRKDGRQETEAVINNGGAAFTAYAKVTVGNNEAYIVEIGQISAGNQTVIIPVTDTNEMLKPGETTTLKVEIYDNRQASGNPLGVYTTDKWGRTRHWEVYLCQEMHTDLGYTQYQENLKDTFSGYLDTVKEYMENSDNRATDLEKYKYAIESGYMLGEAYMTRRTADDISWIVDRINEGRMEIGAGQFNFTMENFGTEETARATYYSTRHLKDMLGVEISQTQRMFDNPAFSKSYVDYAASAGIKYGIHSMNPDRSPYHQKREYDMFYMEGNDPDNKLLIFNGKAYSENYGLGGNHFDTNGGVEKAESSILNLFKSLESRTGRGAYPYDKFPMLLVPYGDNSRPMEDQIINANALNKKWSDAGYAYPHIKTAFPDEFFEDVESEYGDLIPVETGTEENWWNDGWGTTAYESGTNKLAGSLIPTAETAASFASLFAGKSYPYTDIYNAYEYNLIYDEHTWGSAGYDDNNVDYHNQFEWKRTNAFAAKNLADKVMDASLGALASTVPTKGKAIYVYNPLNWERNDVVTVEDITGFPEHFAIMDDSDSIPYTVEDGVLTFIAPAVPAYGYKTFEIVSAASAPKFESKVTAGDNFIENSYYKVTFAPDGTVSSIIDKQNGNREMVDSASDAKFNQYQYYDDHGIPFANMGADFSEDKWTLYTPEADAGKLTVTETAVGASASLDTSAFRADSIVQTVTLYNDMPRIDIKNEVVKSPLPSVKDKEEAFYTFPFKADGEYEIRYDLPAGNVAEGEQVYGTSTDWYTANKWVNVQDADGYNMTLAIPNSGLVQFGERRTGNWSFDYKSENPYIYSYVMNNMWQTNFQGDQPGYVSFRYAISSNKGEGMEDTARFGWEVSNPLQASVIDGAQQGTAKTADSYIGVDNKNVQISTVKMAEANGEGMILRFHEIAGKDTGKVTVTLPFSADAVIETNVIEEDIKQISGKGSTFTFEMTPYDVKTFRVKFGSAPKAVTGLNAVTSEESRMINLSLTATATASSEYDSNYTASNAVDASNGKDWAARFTKEAWIQLSWKNAVEIGSILIADRPNGVDNVTRAVISFSDGSSMTVTDLDQGGRPQTITFDAPKTVNWVKVQVYGTDTTGNVGLSALECYSPESTKPDAEGTMLTWNAASDALYYEIFRSTDNDFTPGSGNYLASTDSTQYFDAQVPGGLSQPYYYKVRAVSAGSKGIASVAVRQKNGELTDTTAPEMPVVNAVTRTGTRVDLDWAPVRDDFMFDYCEIYRNGELIGKTKDNYLCTYRDKTAQPNTEYSYVVRAIDVSGNYVDSAPAVAKTYDTESATLSDLKVSIGTLSPEFDSHTHYYALNLGDNFGRFDGVAVTATAASDKAEIYVNGVKSESGKESKVVPISDPGDKVVIKVIEGDVSKVYTITAGEDAPVFTAQDAISGSQFDNQDPERTIDGSGLTGNGLDAKHDNDGSAFSMWHTDANPGENAWIQFDLGKVCKLDEMWIWNLNQQNNVGRGLKNVKIQYTADGVTWYDLEPEEGMSFSDSPDGYPFQLAQSSGENGSSATNLNDGKNSPVRFGGAEARYVKVTAHPQAGVGSWGDIYFGLSEVRFTQYLKLKDIVTATSVTVASETGENAITSAGGSIKMTATVKPDDATRKKVTWSIADPKDNVAVISEDGLLSARRNGVVEVVATAADGSGVSGKCTVTVSGQPEVISGVISKSGNDYDNDRSGVNVSNDSGMLGIGSVYDLADNNPNALGMWHTDANPGENAWIEFDLGSVQTVGEMWIWNINQQNNTDRGLKNVKIEYRSADTDEWQALDGEGDGEYDFTFARASGKNGMSATNLADGKPVVFNLDARYIRITADPETGKGNYGSPYYGLSEVRFTKGQKQDPEPEIIKGDVDNNKVVNVSDIISLKSLIMNGKWSDAQLKAGDMNNDNTLTVSDMLSIKNIIMTQA